MQKQKIRIRLKAFDYKLIDQSASENPGTSTASSGITQASWCAAQASACWGVNRLPRRE